MNKYDIFNDNNIPSWLVSSAHDKYQDSLDFSRASLSYLSSVLLSTIPVNDIICPPIVDFPASKNVNDCIILHSNILI